MCNNEECLAWSPLPRLLVEDLQKDSRLFVPKDIERVEDRGGFDDGGKRRMKSTYGCCRLPRRDWSRSWADVTSKRVCTAMSAKITNTLLKLRGSVVVDVSVTSGDPA